MEQGDVRIALSFSPATSGWVGAGQEVPAFGSCAQTCCQPGHDPLKGNSCVVDLTSLQSDYLVSKSSANLHRNAGKAPAASILITCSTAAPRSNPRAGRRRQGRSR